ncbi:hypothetical protein EOM82_08970 [bacterium]|nr:hypothetical protein [bacterium]
MVLLTFIIYTGDKMKKALIFIYIILIIFMFAACGEGLGGEGLGDELNDDGIGSNGEIFIPDGADTDMSNGSSGDEQPVITTVTMVKANVSVNVRSGAGSSYSGVGKLSKNDMVVYKGEKNGWYITLFKGKTAYVNAGSLYTKLVTMSKDSEIIENVINIGYLQLGYPYVWGSERYHWGNGVLNTKFVEGRFDCSALTQYIYYLGAGVKMGLTTREQVKQGTEVAKANIRRGDLLFFTNSSRYYKTGIERVGHVALYLGDNYILHTASDHAVIEPMSSLRWDYYITARRFV